MIDDTRALSEDFFLGGRIRLRQPVKGYRAGMDAIILASAVDAAETLMEAGCGAGAALLCVAHRHPRALLTGYEIDPSMAALAHANASINASGARIDVRHGDILALPMAEVFGGVFCNPPFDQPGHGNAPHPSRAGAYLSAATPDTWIAALSNRLQGGGALTMIQRAHHLPALLSAFNGRLGGVQVLPLRPFVDEPAKRVLVRAVKGSRAPFQLWAGLDLHERNGARHTQEVAALLAGDACIDWRSGRVRPN